MDVAPGDSPSGRVLLRAGSGILSAGRDAKEKQEFLWFPVEQQVRDGHSRLAVPGEFSKGHHSGFQGREGIPAPSTWIYVLERELFWDFCALVASQGCSGCLWRLWIIQDLGKCFVLINSGWF